jgi:hypothetical protein
MADNGARCEQKIHDQALLSDVGLFNIVRQ